ncbi:MAG: hypothetical protein IPH44_24600 [Myxococcales bacterium]|nr:hypothetical protein [Myxococcales bacterium]MBK7191582.1 hypothetical protein [Myxococcales bacterium]MBP6849603.1 hypothetical protein [Kofleriaceae bacterium]
MSPVASLVAVHEELDRVFAQFRELVLIGDGARAAAVLAVYQALTADHAAAEEALLVPLLDDAARWPADLYTGQHAKLLAAIDRAAAAVAGLAAGAPGWRARALAALDVAAPLHHLAEHHHLAEEQDLLPLVGEREPARLVEVAARFWATHAAHRATLTEAAAALT